HDASVAQDERGVPERLHHGKDPERLQTAKSGAEESRREEEDQHRGDREELAEAHALASVEDAPAQPGGREHTGHARCDAAPSGRRRRFRHDAPEKDDGFGSLPEYAGERDQTDDPETLRRTRLVDALLDITPDAPRVLLHPPRVPREEDDGDEENRGADDVGA